jgi:dipeptidyl aminopeptidase/acylaminoacyl peptidase
MNVDEAARRAASALLDSSAREVDPDDLRAGLDRLRARRRTARVVTVAVFALVLVVSVAALPRGDDRAAPATPASNGTHTSTMSSPTREILMVLSGTRFEPAESSTSRPEAGFPLVPGCLPASAAFSPDGRRLAFSCVGQGAYVSDSSGAEPVRVDLADSGVAWTSDGSRVVTAQSTELDIIDPDTLHLEHVALPTGWQVRSIDVNGADRAVLDGLVGGRAALLTVDVSGANPRMVLRDDGSIYEPRWSPDGRTIAFLRKAGVPLNSGFGDVTLVTVRADGSGRKVLAKLGVAAFVGAPAVFDWSPAGRMVTQLRSKGGNTLVEVLPGGRTVPLVGGSPSVAWRPGS